MTQKVFILSALMLAMACVSTQHSNVPQRRKTSSSEDPQKPSLATVLYSWTDNPAAASDPQGFVTARLKNAQECIAKISKSRSPVAGCEGNGFAAGPALYTCDNPFTSHDYGSTVVVVKTVAGKNDFFDFVPEGWGDAASGVERETYGDAKFSAILYDFRASSLNTKALAVRNTSILEPQAYAVTLGVKGFAKFKDHAPYTCTAQSKITDILAQWGDQMEFMARVFFPEMDPSGEQYLHGKELNVNGVLAAVASDAVAMPIDILKAKASELSGKYAEVKESLTSSSCQETSSLALRSCFSERLYKSVLGDMGTDARPTYAWSLATTQAVLVNLGVLTQAEVAKLNSNEKLLAAVTAKAQSNPQAMQRIGEAYQCAMLVRSSMQNNHLGLWSSH